MCVFRLPKKLLHEIEAIIVNFWWSHNRDGQGMHWKAWSSLGYSKNMGGLGFRDLNCFNRALIAKQGWRLLKEPNSLVARIFKEKYFSRGTMVEAKLGYCPSQIWRSLRSVMDLVKAGMFWRVGNGKSIRIWEDNWVPIPSTFQIKSPIQLLNPHATVDVLIDVEMKAWKSDLVQAIFNQEEALKICCIPLSYSGADDTLIWGLTENGRFTVKSAYFTDLKHKFALQGQSSRDGQNVAMWRKVWGMETPGKVKHLIWKALTDILPTKEKLFKRTITDNSLCPICLQEVETVVHALWECSAAGDVWGVSDSFVQKLSSSIPDFFSLWAVLQTKLVDAKLAQVATVMYSLWRRRNEFVFHNKFKDPTMLWQWSVAELELFRQLQHGDRDVNQLDTRPSSQAQLHRWKQSINEYVKVNVDAAFDKQSSQMGIGIVIRDGRGNLVATLAAPRQFVLSAVAAEGYALLRAVVLADELGLTQVEFEGDVKTIVDIVNGRVTSDSWLGQLTDDIKSRLSAHSCWFLSYFSRFGNKAAHAVAKLALSLDSEYVWLEDCPPQILSIISFDKCCINSQ